MVNVLFIHSSSELYGSDRSLLNIVKYINKDKYSVHVILPCPGPLVDEMKKLPDVKVEIFEVAVLRRKNLSFKGGIGYIKDYSRSCKFIKQYIKENNIDLVDTNTAVVFPGAVAAKRCKIKSTWHIREIIKSNLENKVISYIMKHNADVIIANSKASGKALCVPEDKVKVVYNAVEDRERVQVTHTKFTVGMAGRINRWKGQKLLVDAAAIVNKKYPDVVYNIAGDVYSGEEYIKEDLIAYIEEKGLTQSVHLLGQVNNMSEFYSGLDIFVLPSTQPEPFGLVVIEAMNFGLPVVATNHGGPVEIIDEGVDGYLVDWEDATEMADRIIELIENPDKCREMGICGQKKKKEQFSVPAMVSNIERVFDEVLNQK
ncbi:MAG: glycosyltransferase family 4 protein [Butyrivibrio sp.]